MDYGQLIVLVIAGLFALGKWLYENAQGSPGREDEPEDEAEARRGRPRSRGVPGSGPFPRSRPGDETEEERLRRFMEALGLPQDSAPPAPMPRPEPPPKVFTPVRRIVVPAPAPEEVKNETGQWLEEMERREDEERRQRQPARPEPVIPAPAPAPASVSKPASMREVAPQMEVSSIPEIHFAPPESYNRPYGKPREPATPAAAAGSSQLRTLLRDATAFKQAFILKEVLGPPKSLSGN